MMHDPFIEQLFDYSKQVTPYLDGRVGSIPDDATEQGVIHIDHKCSSHIQKLYDQLAQNTPESGSAYWLTRTWDLLCWQPVYVSFVSIYACKGLPDIKRMGQYTHPDFISGFQFESAQHHRGSAAELIQLAGLQLQELFEFYRAEMNDWTRIRPGFTKHLLADSILGCIVKLQTFMPKLSNEYLQDQAKQWFDACNLPVKLLSSLQVDIETDKLRLIRTSCCLVYKCEGRKWCTTCPRNPENKR
ncbi:siderophore ferric iron reductase [Vibrio sp. Of7-15]|uniref:siderophore ferric iron reductase n=1 Tax=Vibrio sp. Of7-15 TaxID=2724879 RepID=UPI001EF34353|nr:siderophore ferric iron reductase [Vibrio sp. Of7-15]MCG7497985.1 siderophore ferric iron reductase [Vibrio sp. Of7-15]